MFQHDAKDQIANTLYVNPKMVIEYTLFDDVFCFNTTYRINNAECPCEPIIGVNHHEKIVVFGVALLFDETVASFESLFTTFLEVTRIKKRVTIFTDQDAVMAKTIANLSSNMFIVFIPKCSQTS